MSKKVIIEKISEKNFSDFFNLINQLAKYEKQKPLDIKIKKQLEKDAFAKNPSFKAYLARYKDKYVGYLIYFMTYSSYLASPILYLEDIFVIKEFRGKGIGQKMFEFCVKQAEEQDCSRMEWCVYNWNKPAIKFYQKNRATKLDKTYFRLNKDQIQEILKGI